jgi:ubiquinone/menaquinone biosynthesis C-methylase UbiE
LELFPLTQADIPRPGRTLPVLLLKMFSLAPYHMDLTMQITDIKELHDFASSYWYVCVLHSGIKMQVFTRLGSQSLPAEQLAQRLGADARATGLFLDALSAMGLVIKTGETYSNAPISLKYLDENSPDFMGNIVYHHTHMYQDWGRLDEAVRSGRPPEPARERTEEGTRGFLLGMRDLAMRGAEVLTTQLDLSECRSFLDLGGGPGTYCLHFCRKHLQLQGVIFDLPGSETIAGEQIRSFGLEQRVRFVAGNFLRDPLPSGPFDVAFLSQILHSCSVDECADLIKKVYPIVKPGGKVIVQEFILNESKTAPPFAAVFALNMLIHTPAGRSYSLQEIQGWFKDAGFIDWQHLVYDLPNDASLVMARKPA